MPSVRRSVCRLLLSLTALVRNSRMKAVVLVLVAAFVASASAQACLNTAGLSMIKGFEGFYAKQYKDVAGILTIGYGTLCSTGTLKCPGPVTEPQAAAELGRAIVAKYAPCVKQYVKATMNNNQYSALISFAYNAGCGALQNVVTATKGVLSGFPARMALYCKATVKGKLTTVQGLVNRRNAEIALFKSTGTTACATSATGAVLRSSAPVPGAVVPAATAPAVPVAALSPSVAVDAANIAHSSAPFPVHAQPAFAKPHLAPNTEGPVRAEAVDTGRVTWVRDRPHNHRKLEMGGLKEHGKHHGKHHKRHHNKH